MAYLDLQIGGGGGGGGAAKPRVGGGGGGGGGDEGGGLKEIVFRPFGPHFGLKIRGAGPPGPSPGTTTVWSCYGSVMC